MIVNERNNTHFASRDFILQESGLGRVLGVLGDLPAVSLAVCNAAGDCIWKSSCEASDDMWPIVLAGEEEFSDIAKQAIDGRVEGELFEGRDDIVISIVPVRIDGEPVGLVISTMPGNGTTPERRVAFHSTNRVCATLISEVMTQQHALAEMVEEISTRYEELALLYEMNKALDVSAKRSDVLDTVSVSVAETLGADLVSITLAGMNIETIYSSSPIECPPSIRLLNILIANLSEDGTGVGVNNLNAGQEKNSASFDYAHAAIVPLSVGEFSGHFSAFRKNTDHPFFSGDVKLLEVVATQLSLALSNIHVLEQQKNLFDASIFSLARLAESRDSETGEHLERMSNYTRVLAEHVLQLDLYQGRFDDDFVESIYRSSPLHDIGKVGIPDSILLKEGALTDEEWEIMKTHTTIGGDTLRDAESRLNTMGDTFLTIGKLIAYNHHEKWDGAGYPKGLQGELIPLAARIVALADAYDAMTSVRCYKDAISHEEAREEIIRSCGTHFDPDIVDAFLTAEAEFQAIRRSSKRSKEINR